MADNQMYWAEQSGWYQPPPSAYQPTPYQMATNPSSSEHSSPPTPQAQQQMHNQPQSLMPNGGPTSNGATHMNNHMQSPMAPMQQQQHPSQAPTNQVGAPNHYNQHEQQLLGHPTTPSHMQPADPTPGYQMQPQAYQAPQQHPPPSSQMYSQTSTSPNNANYPPPNSSNSVPNTQQVGPVPPAPPMSAMQQPPQQQAPMYPQQQYSPAPYWNQSGLPPQHQQQMAAAPAPAPAQQHAASHHQSGYGQPQQSNGMVQGPPPTHQGPITSPGVPQGAHSSYYSATNGAPPPPQSQPYDSRRSNIPPNSYNSTYPQPDYYNDQRQAPPPPPQSDPYEQQAPWSNGYYQPSHSPYANGAVHYSSGPPPPPPPHHHQPNYQHGYPGQQALQHSMHHGQQRANYPGNHQAHHQQHMPPHHQQSMMHHHHSQPQHWSQPPPHQAQMQPNRQMPIKERKTKSGLEKKPVKPRGPRKPPNPDAPGRGRRKNVPPEEESKGSAYAKFYQIKQKEITKVNKGTPFGEVSKIVAREWDKLPDEEKAIYAKDVSIKRKEILKKKASEQAQDLIRGMTHEHEVLE